MEIRNAIIKSTSLSSADHGVLSSFIHLDFGGTGQGFGGYSLYSPEYKEQQTGAGIFIWRVMEIAGVTEWKNLPGQTVRVKADHSKVHAIGHIIKDDWFDPSQEFK